VEKVRKKGSVNLNDRHWVSYYKPWNCVTSSWLQAHGFRQNKALTRITSRPTDMAIFTASALTYQA